MELALIDWIIIVAFLLLSLMIGLYYRKKGGSSLGDFFLGGRSLPWYIAGISMVATTFAADTPLAVSELVGAKGISQNWLWWSFLIGGMLTTFFFAKLWHRSGVLTELELIELRYSGKPAAFLRGFKAVYLGLLLNCIIIGWVNKALVTLLVAFFGVDEFDAHWYTFIAMAIAVVYSSFSGLLGIVITDAVQFIIAMVGCVILAVIVLNAEQVGGVAGLKEKLPAGYLDFFPSMDTSSGSFFVVSLGAFLSFVAVQWWASWYPGAEPGGGGYVAQRMMAARSEKDSFLATLFFQFAHYCLRPWPWIIVGLAAIVLYDPMLTISDTVVAEAIQQAPQNFDNSAAFYAENPSIQAMAKDPAVEQAVEYSFNKRLGYVYAMRDFLPDGLKGLLLVAFLAAYLSTISTQLNWGASYVVNDLYGRFAVAKDRSNRDAHLVTMGRVATIIIMFASIGATFMIDSISGAWAVIMQCGAGLGMVLILRWYWWRINAWSEIAATLAPFPAFLIGKYVLEPNLGPEFVNQNGTFLVTVGFTTIVWILVTYATNPTQMATLEKFAAQVQPQGNWRPVSGAKVRSGSAPIGALVGAWLTSVILLYSVLIGVGKCIFGYWTEMSISISVAAISGLLLWWIMSKFRIF